MYGDPFPAARPPGLRRRRLPAGTVRWRLDPVHPGRWAWAAFPEPRHRFDSAAGRFRTRYAAEVAEGAARERYLDTGRYVPTDHADHHLVRLEARRPLRVLDLRTQSNLDALDLDDQVSTGHHAPVWDACHRLADAARGWWPDLDGILYRSRTTPETSSNLAFFAAGAFEVTAVRLGDAVELLDDLVLEHGFTVGFDY